MRKDDFLWNNRVQDFRPGAFYASCVFPPEGEVDGFTAVVPAESQAERSAGRESGTGKPIPVGYRSIAYKQFHFCPIFAWLRAEEMFHKEKPVYVYSNYP
jgi:hypothetical protein